MKVFKPDGTFREATLEDWKEYAEQQRKSAEAWKEIADLERELRERNRR